MDTPGATSDRDLRSVGAPVSPRRVVALRLALMHVVLVTAALPRLCPAASLTTGGSGRGERRLERLGEVVDVRQEAAGRLHVALSALRLGGAFVVEPGLRSRDC